MTLVIGLTGGIASGKSSVSNVFKDRGIPVVDADIVAREVVEPGTKGLADIVATFGKEMLNKGELDRKKLGKLVFSDEKKLEQLNAILADELNQTIDERIQMFRDKQTPVLIVDVPLLYENGYETKMDLVMVVYVPVSIQKKRLIARDALTVEEAQQRLTSQWPIEKKRQLADVVIDNSGTREQTKAQVEAFLRKIQVTR